MSVVSERPAAGDGSAGFSNGAGDRDSVSEVMDRTVAQATSAATALAELLRSLEALAGLSAEHHRNEERIGQLFARAQDYVDRAQSEAQEHARRLVAAAEAEAARIVASAREEAHRLATDPGRQLSIPPEAVTQLQLTIDGFARLNNDLLRELATLNLTLTDRAQIAPSAPSGTPARNGGHPLPPPPRTDLPPAPSPAVLARHLKPLREDLSDDQVTRLATRLFHRAG
jgi:hypothetical protein